MNITKKQERALKRFAERVRKLRSRDGWEYRVRVTCLPSWQGLPGLLSMTARTPEMFEQLQRMLNRVVPDAKLRNFEQGRGWHYLDKTQYYYAELFYLLAEE